MNIKQRFFGFTMIETLLALALILALVLPLLTWLENSHRLEFNREKHSAAILMLQRIVQEYRAGVLTEVQQALRSVEVHNETRYGFALLWEQGPAMSTSSENVAFQRLRQVHLTLFWTDTEGKVNELAVFLASAE